MWHSGPRQLQLGETRSHCCLHPRTIYYYELVILAILSFVTLLCGYVLIRGAPFIIQSEYIGATCLAIFAVLLLLVFFIVMPRQQQQQQQQSINNLSIQSQPEQLRIIQIAQRFAQELDLVRMLEQENVPVPMSRGETPMSAEYESSLSHSLPNTVENENAVPSSQVHAEPVERIESKTEAKSTLTHTPVLTQSQIIRHVFPAAEKGYRL